MYPSRGDLREYAEWLQGVPWQHFCTLTFAWPVSDWRAPQVFKAFMNRLERSFRCPIAYLRGDEKRFSGCGKPAAPRHYHVMLAAAVRLDATFIENTWMLMAGFRANGAGADVRAYDPKKGNAIAYCLKFIFQPDGDWDFKNLDLYLCPPNAMNRNRRQRRRLARNAQRMLEAAPLPVCDKIAAGTLAPPMCAGRFSSLPALDPNQKTVDHGCEHIREAGSAGTTNALSQRSVQ